MGEPQEKILVLNRLFELKSLEEAWKAGSQSAKLEDKEHKIPAQKAVPEILNIKDERTEIDKESNTNPYKFKDVEVKVVNYLKVNQMKFITNANGHQNVILEFYGEKGEQFN